MEETNFERLRVYQQAVELADRIWAIVTQWDHFQKTTVGSQMVRAVDSIGANIAEGLGRGSSQDNRRFVRISRGSLYEVKHWLKRASNRSLLSEDQRIPLESMIKELLPSLNAYLNSLDRRC